MCGIYGYINLTSTSNIETDFIKHSGCIDIVGYRGPDNKSIKFYNSITDDKESYNIVLGHSRLSIIDLDSSANQPFELDGYSIVYNGEIFNYLEIKSDLVKLGYSFKTNSDTEVLLRLYMLYGLKAFNMLNGMWAIIIYDKINKNIVLSRDRFSIKPMYILRTESVITVSSEIKQLKNNNTLSPNFKNIRDFLYLSLLDHNDDTFFNEVEKLPAATVRTINLQNGNSSDYVYWDYNVQSTFTGNYSDAVKLYKELFYDSVKIRLRADVPVGNTLSGGLDSSSIAVVSQDLGADLLNFSVVSKEKNTTEEKYVDELIKEKKLNVKKISSDKLNPWSLLEETIYHHDEPLLSFSSVNHFNMMRMIKDKTNLKVVFSGQGGDEGLCGYGKYQVMYIKSLLKTKLLSGFKELYYSINRLSDEFNLYSYKRYLPKIFADNYLNFKIDKPDDFNLNGDITPRQIMDYKKYSVPPLCHYEDRNSTAYGLEIRLPFLDHRLVEFSLSLPVSYLILDGVSKRILRDAINILPKNIKDRKNKKGFNIPEKDYFSMDESFYFIDLVLESDSFVNRYNLVSDKLKKELISRKFNNRTPYRLIQRVIFTEVWARQYNF